MNRTVQEVTFMAAKMKENGYRLPSQTQDSVAESIVQTSKDIAKKEKVKSGNNIIIPETNWSQDQQKALESAIMKYRKTAGGDRWEKIAHCVPEKTKEECLVRYKYLCELVKSQKKSEETETDLNESEVQESESVPKTAMDVETKPVTAEDLANEEWQKKPSGKKRNKRKERRKRDLSSDEDSDNAYTYTTN